MDGHSIGSLQDLLCLTVETLNVITQGGDLRLENVMLLRQIFGCQQMAADILRFEIFLKMVKEKRKFSRPVIHSFICASDGECPTSRSLIVEATVSKSLMTDMSWLADCKASLCRSSRTSSSSHRIRISLSRLLIWSLPR